MAAKEAEQVVTNQEHDEEWHEDLVPGDCHNSMLIATDSFENLSTDEFEIDKSLLKKRSHIHEIVRQTSKDDSSSGEQTGLLNHVGANGDGATPSASEDSSGEQSDVSAVIFITNCIVKRWQERIKFKWSQKKFYSLPSPPK